MMEGVSGGFERGRAVRRVLVTNQCSSLPYIFTEIALLLSLFLIPHLLPLIDPATNSRTRLIQLGKAHHCTTAPLPLPYLLFSSFSMNPSPFLLVLYTYHSQNFLVISYLLGLS